MADTIIENLITRFGFEFDQKTLDKINGQIENTVKTIKRMAIAVTAVGVGVAFFAKKIAEANDELGKLSRRTGIDIKALQELGFVAELNGASIDSMNSALENLSRLSSEAARGIGAGVEVFGLLGISVIDAKNKIKTADDLLLEVSDSIAQLNTQAERLELAGKLGIDPSLLLTIQQGSKAIKQQRKEAEELGFIIDEKAAKAAEKFNDEFLRVRKIISGVSNAIGQQLMKQLIPMMRFFINWFKINKSIIKQNISSILIKITKAFQVFFNIGIRVFNVVLKLIDIFGGLENSLIAAGSALLLLNAKALIFPTILAAIGIALFLLIEDLQKFTSEGESAFGEFEKRLDRIKWLGRRENFWKDFFANPEKVLSEAWRDIKFIFKAEWFSIEEAIFQSVIRITRFFETAWEKSLKFVKDLASDILNFIPKLDEKTEAVLAGGAGVAQKPIFGGESLIGQGIDKGANIFSSPTPTNTTNNNRNIDNRTVNISVNGGNPAEVREILENVLMDKFAAAKRNLSSNIDY